MEALLSSDELPVVSEIEARFVIQPKESFYCSRRFQYMLALLASTTAC